LIKWSDEFSVNIVSIDKQHRLLIDLINEVEHSISIKNNIDATDTIFNALTSYIDYHFSTEEYYFELFDYPHKNEHLKEHVCFILKIDDFKKNTINTSDKIKLNEIITLFEFLKKWLAEHIRHTDKKYEIFFIERGLG